MELYKQTLIKGTYRNTSSVLSPWAASATNHESTDNDH